ncbi:MAG: MinD/ParA family protein [bacterium]|nr:MinD/ParA family protein [bacterium]
MQDQASKLRNLAHENFKESVRIIAVTSGKGGVGKTSISTNLAITLAHMGKRVLIFDADMGLANIDIMLGIKPSFTLQHVLQGDKTLDEIIVDGPAGIKIIPASSGVQQLTQLTETQRSFFLSELNKLRDRIDILLIDTAAGIAPNVIEFVSASSEVIVVTTPEPTAITDAYALIKVLIRSLKPVVKTPKIYLFVNMVRDQNEARDVENNLKLVSDRFLGVSLSSIGFMQKDDAVLRAVRKQVPFVLNNTPDRPSASIKMLASRLCAVNVQEANISLSQFGQCITGAHES